MENPYQPIASAGSNHPGGEVDSIPETRCFGGRRSILFVALVFGTVSAMSLAGFLFNLAHNYPGTDQPVIVVDPLWMLGHLIRGIGFGILTYLLLQYQAAIKKSRHLAGGEANRLVISHDALWKTSALVVGVLAVYGLAYAAYGAYVAFARPSM